MDPLDLFLLAVVAAGAWSAWRQLADLARARTSRGWPVTTGQVVRSEVVQERAAIGETAQVQVPAVEYVYTVAGREWRGLTVSFAPRLYTSFRRRAEAVCRRHPAGAQVAVSYDPVDPSRSCLEPAGTGEALGWGAVGASLAAAIGAATALLARMA